MKNLLKFLALSIAFVSGCAMAAPSIMTFDGTPSSAPTSFSENGFTVSTLSSHLHFTGDDTLMLHNGCCSNPYKFFADDNSSFNFSSFDIVSNSTGMTFTASNGSVFGLADGITGHFNLTSDFSNITSVVWQLSDDTGYDAKIDNVTFNAQAVPEPANIALFGLGLIGVMVSRHKFAVSKGR